MWVLVGLALAALSSDQSAAQEPGRKLLKMVSAEYPAVLKQRNIGGVVKLRVTVRADGTVKEAEATGGNPILAESAVKAVRQWLFVPAQSDAHLLISIRFDPKSDTAALAAQPQ